MQVFPLSEGSFTVDKTKKFLPFNTETDDMHQRPKGSLLVEVQPFAVITSYDVIVLDAGLGFHEDEVLQLHKNLMEAGINPGEVTKVLMSHLHKDHSGGLCLPGDELPFENALYYIHEKELNYAFEKGGASYNTEALEFLKGHSRVELLRENNSLIDNYIRAVITGGHSPFHQAFWIKEDGRTIFFGGDEAPQLTQMRHKFAAKYDYDGKKAMELRQTWWQQGEAEKWTFLFYHDVRNPVYSFE